MIIKNEPTQVEMLETLVNERGEVKINIFTKNIAVIIANIVTIFTKQIVSDFCPKNATLPR